jgi:uncharacterized protein with HEPN domain
VNSSTELRLHDMLRAMEQVQIAVSHGSFEVYENNLASQMIVERGLEIVSEASRSLPGELKQRHPTIPWDQVRDIGNKLRHEYHRISQAIIWETARIHLPRLLGVCEAELEREQQRARPAGDV